MTELDQPGLGTNLAPGLVVVESPEDPATDTHVVRAQRLLRFVAAGRQDARRVAEDLVMGLLLSPSDGRHHPAARLVLNDPELTIPRALELALRLIGPPPRGKKSKPTKDDAG